MAALQGSFRSGSTSLTGGTAQTVIQIVAPTNQRLKVLSWRIAFNGTNSANTPATVQIERQTGGTFTNTAVAPVKVNDPTGTGETLQASAKTAVTVEPTVGDILDEFFEPVFGGFIGWQYTPGQELLVPGGTLLGFKLNAAQSVNAEVTVYYEE
jgi:hypothetical protein